jgi:hypothetical protein
MILAMSPLAHADHRGSWQDQNLAFTWRDSNTGPNSRIREIVWLNRDPHIISLRGYGSTIGSAPDPYWQVGIENRVSIFENGVRVQSGNVAYGNGSAEVDNSTFMYECKVPTTPRGYRSYLKTRVKRSGGSYSEYEFYSTLLNTDCIN